MVCYPSFLPFSSTWLCYFHFVHVLRAGFVVVYENSVIPLEKAMAPHSSTLAWKIPWTDRAWWAAVHGVARSRTWLSDFTFTFHFHALEKEMATHSSVLAWRIPGTGEPGGLLSMGSHRVGHDWSDLAAAAAFIPQHHQADCSLYPKYHFVPLLLYFTTLIPTHLSCLSPNTTIPEILLTSHHIYWFIHVIHHWCLPSPAETL